MENNAPIGYLVTLPRGQYWFNNALTSMKVNYSNNNPLSILSIEYSIYSIELSLMQYKYDNYYYKNNNKELTIKDDISILLNNINNLEDGTIIFANGELVNLTNENYEYNDIVLLNGWNVVSNINDINDYDYYVTNLNTSNLWYTYNNMFIIQDGITQIFNYYDDLDIDNLHYITTPKMVLKSNLKLIGDKTETYITIPEDNTEILSYTLGEGVNRQFVPKTLQINAPCEYDVNGNVISRT